MMLEAELEVDCIFWAIYNHMRNMSTVSGYNPMGCMPKACPTSETINPHARVIAQAPAGDLVFGAVALWFVLGAPSARGDVVAPQHVSVAPGRERTPQSAAWRPATVLTDIVYVTCSMSSG